MGCSMKSRLLETENLWMNGIMGVVVGDVLGMPVQFFSRAEVKESPIMGIEGYGTYNMPPGTWSDDSSMTLATLHSIREKKGIDYDDIMNRFMAWLADGEYTPAGEAFDEGNTCVYAIGNYALTHNYKTCGKTGEYANGNGALMRIMPVCLYAYVRYKNGEMNLKEALACVHQASALTHNHIRSQIACGIYFFMACAILDEEGTLTEKLQKGMDAAKKHYTSDITNMVEWSRFARMTDLSEFARLPEDAIKSSGYVVDSLEAAVWSLITTASLKEGLLKAVNLGDDTDTVGAIAGGLGSLYYGYNGIPTDWLEAVIKREDIMKLCESVWEEYHVR